MSYKPVEIPGKFGFGTMSMTWTPTPPPFEQSIDTLKFVTSHKEFGTKLINAGEFYGPDDSNLKLLQQFLKENSPEENESLIVSIKGGVDKQTLRPDGSKESITKSIENIVSYFPKQIDQNFYLKLLELILEFHTQKLLDTLVNLSRMVPLMVFHYLKLVKNQFNLR